MAHAISLTHQCLYSAASLSNGVDIHQDDRHDEHASLSETCPIAGALRYQTRDNRAPERSLQPQQLSLQSEPGFANEHPVANAPKRTGERSQKMSHVLVSASESRNGTPARADANKTKNWNEQLKRSRHDVEGSMEYESRHDPSPISSDRRPRGRPAYPYAKSRACLVTAHQSED